MISENEVLECITRYEKKLNNTDFYIGKSIPEKKAKNAIKAYGAPGIGTVLALYDGTVFGSAKEGILFTERSIFYHYLSGKWSVDYDDIHHLEIKQTVPGYSDPMKDVLHIFTQAKEYKIEINGLDKRYILAILEDICGMDQRFDVSAYMEPVPQNYAGVGTMDSVYFQRHRCIYCNSRTTTMPDGVVLCRSCNRVNKPMAPISVLHFETIQEEYLKLLRTKDPGLCRGGIHEEIVFAAENGRLKIAAAISDGYYDSKLRYDSDLMESEQFIRSLDGIPIEGCFYSHPLQEIECPVWIVRLEKSNGKKQYVLLTKDKYDQLAKSLENIESDFFVVDQYDPKKRSEGL